LPLPLTLRTYRPATGSVAEIDALSRLAGLLLMMSLPAASRSSSARSTLPLQAEGVTPRLSLPAPAMKLKVSTSVGVSITPLTAKASQPLLTVPATRVALLAVLPWSSARGIKPWRAITA